MIDFLSQYFDDKKKIRVLIMFIDFYAVYCGRLSTRSSRRRNCFFYKNAFKYHLPGTTVVIATFHSVVRRRKVNDIYFSVPHSVLSLSLITLENKALTANYCYLNKIINKVS